VRALASAGLPVPSTVRDVHGADHVAFGSEGGSARLQRFLLGTPWREVTSTVALGESLGRSLAAVHCACAAFEHVSASRTHSWDVARCDQHADKLRHVGDEGRRHALARVLKAHTQRILPTLGRCKQGMLHGDFNDENVLVNGEQLVGLLDFGDALRGALVQDVGITLAYAAQRGDVPNLPLAAAIVQGYATGRAADGEALSSDERRLLFPLMLGRLSTTVLVGEARRAAEPDHATWFSHVGTAELAFDRLVGMDENEAYAALNGGQVDHRGAIERA